MPAYLIANVEVKDAEKIRSYLEGTPDILKKYTGRFLVRGGEQWIAEGDWKPFRLVVVEFDSLDEAKEFWNSEEYAPLKAIRQSSAYTEMVFVEGLSKELYDQLNG